MHHTLLSTLQSRDDGHSKPSNYGSLDEKFSHALSALLSDEDSDKLDNETSLPPSAHRLLDNAERSGGNVSAETPDYSADFNSESEKIGNMQERLDRYV